MMLAFRVSQRVQQKEKGRGETKGGKGGQWETERGGGVRRGNCWVEEKQREKERK